MRDFRIGVLGHIRVEMSREPIPLDWPWFEAGRADGRELFLRFGRLYVGHSWRTAPQT